MLFSEHEFGKDEKFTAVANFGNGIKEYMLSNKVARVDDLVLYTVGGCKFVISDLCRAYRDSRTSSRIDSASTLYITVDGIDAFFVCNCCSIRDDDLVVEFVKMIDAFSKLFGKL